MFKKLSASAILFYCLSIALLWTLANGHVFRLGQCPEVEPMADFEVDRFLGEWFIIQKFRSASDCVRENFTKVDDSYFVRRSARPFGQHVLTSISGKIILITLNANNRVSRLAYFVFYQQI